MRLGYKSLISIIKGEVLLENVNFINIVVKSKSYIIQTSSSVCDSNLTLNRFIYNGGTVSFINNGFEVISENPLAGFISLCKFKEVIIKNVNFTMNLFSGSGSLMLINNIFRLELSDNYFGFELSNRNLIVIVIDDGKDLINSAQNFLNYEHLVLRNNRFEYIVANRLIMIKSENICLNVVVEGNYFGNVEVNTSILLFSMTEFQSTCVDGKLLKSDDGTLYKSFPRLTYFKGNSFVSNLAAEFMIELENVGRLEISDCDFSRNRNFSIGTSNSIYSKIKNFKGYAILNLFKVVENCDSLIHVSSGFDSNLTGLTFDLNLCSLASFEQIRGQLNFLDSLGSNNTVMRDRSLFSFQYFYRKTEKSMSSPPDSQFRNLEFSNCTLRGSKNSILLISDLNSGKIKIENIGFIQSSIAITIVELKILEIFNITIINSISKEISGIILTPTIGAHVHIDEILFQTSSQFLKISSIIPVKMKFDLINSKIIENTNKYIISIDNGLTLVNNSVVERNEFIGNNGTIFDLQCLGEVNLLSNVFSSNFDKQTTILSGDVGLSLFLDSNIFSYNRGRELINVINSDTSAEIISINNTFEYNTGSCMTISKISLNDTNSIFRHNTFKVGTILYAYSFANLYFTNSLFINNTATKYGNLFISLYSKLTLTNIEAYQNKAVGKGGFLFIDQYSTFFIYNSIINQNSAESGSCIYSHYSNTLNKIKDSTFSNNSASESSCISIIESSLNLLSSNFTSNTGKICSNLHISFESSINLSSSSFKNLESNGTSILIEGKSKAYIESSTILQSLTQKSSAIVIFDSTLEVNNSKFQNSSSDPLILCDNS